MWYFVFALLMIISSLILLTAFYCNGFYMAAVFKNFVDRHTDDSKTPDELARRRAERRARLLEAETMDRKQGLLARPSGYDASGESPNLETVVSPDQFVSGQVQVSTQSVIIDRPAGDLAWVDPSWETRRHNRQVAAALVELTYQQQTATALLAAVTHHEQQRVALQQVQERARLARHKTETEISELQKRQARARHDAEMVAQGKCRKQQEGERQRALAEQDHRIALLRREIEIKRLDAILAEPMATPKPKRKSKPEPPAAEPAKDQTPDALRRHLAAQHEVKLNRAEATRRIKIIHDRAAAEGRDIADDEQDEIDAIHEALAQAEAEIRQSSASDL